MLYFKWFIQIFWLFEGFFNFLWVLVLVEYIKLVVVIFEEVLEDEELENFIEISIGFFVGELVVVVDFFDQMFGFFNGFVKDDRDFQIESLKREVEMFCFELEKIKLEVQWYIVQLKSQVNVLEGELEEQWKQKQKVLVDNEQFCYELVQLRVVQLEGEWSQGLCEEVERKVSVMEVCYNKLKEKYSEFVYVYVELFRKNVDIVKQLMVMQ